MKYHALFVIFEKAVKFEIVVCCELKVALYGLKLIELSVDRTKHAHTRLNTGGNSQKVSEYDQDIPQSHTGTARKSHRTFTLTSFLFLFGMIAKLYTASKVKHRPKFFSVAVFMLVRRLRAKIWPDCAIPDTSI